MIPQARTIKVPIRRVATAVQPPSVQKSTATAALARQMMTANAARTQFADDGLRPFTNLTIGEKFRKGETDEGAMWFYTGKVRFGRSPATIFFTWMAALAGLVTNAPKALPTTIQMKSRSTVNAIKEANKLSLIHI